MADTSAASYIHMVQHLIEECILFKMSKEECMEALSKHANILPAITSTGITARIISHEFHRLQSTTVIPPQAAAYMLWKELEKENKEFFEAYYTKRAEDDQVEKSASSGFDILRERLENMVLDSSTK